MKRTFAMVLAMVLLVTCVAGATLAWLNDKDDAITNTFTMGKVDVELDETTGTEYKMTPGSNTSKDPKVTLKAGSEAAYVFVKIERQKDFDTYMEFEIAKGWTKLTGVNEEVYYRTQDALTAEGAVDVSWSVLEGDQVKMKDDVTGFADGAETNLTFTAYAIQSENMADANAAWAALTTPAT